MSRILAINNHPVDSCFFIFRNFSYNLNMGATKIINVLNSDDFEDIFEEFKKAEAEEVIFILPKNSKFVKKEEHFATLASESRSSQKRVTFMTADESVKQYAPKYGFKLLSDSDIDVDPELAEIEEKEQEENAGIIEEVDEREEDHRHSDADVGEDISEDLIEENEEEDLADLAMARYKTSKMSDIRKLEDMSRVKVEKDEEKSSELKLKKGLASEKDLNKLENIWFSRDRVEKQKKSSSGSGKSFWDNISLIKKERVHNKISWIFLAIGAVLLGAILFFFLGKAQIIVKPQREKFNFSIDISVSSEYPRVDISANKIPGQLLLSSAKVPKDFTSSGQKEVARKARGEVTVFNNFNSDPQGLIATTRFESTAGLTFRTPRAITIPGAKLVDGKLVPGSIVVEVLADKPGQEYNINADEFKIPGFKGSPRYEGFYAESSEPMSGGIVGLSKVVTEQDFNTAKDSVTNEALAKALDDLKSQTNGLKITEKIENQITELKSTAEVDDAVEGFAISVTAEAQTIAFQEEDLIKLVEAFVNKEGDIVLLKETVSMEYKDMKLNLEKKELSFKLSAQGEVAKKVDQQKVISGLLGMKQKDIKNYLLNIPEIESARVILSPFWIRSMPQKTKDVEIEVLY